MGGCFAAFLVSLVLGPGTAIASPGGLAEPGSDSATIELGAAVSILNLHKLNGNGYCGYGLRFGYRWKDYLLLEGGYDHYADLFDDDPQSLFLAGPRAGFRKGGLGVFIKLQPGVLRAVNYDPSVARSRFVLSAGGVLEAYVKPHVYVRFDFGYLVTWSGDATFRHPNVQHRIRLPLVAPHLGKGHIGRDELAETRRSPQKSLPSSAGRHPLEPQRRQHMAVVHYQAAAASRTRVAPGTSS